MYYYGNSEAAIASYDQKSGIADVLPSIRFTRFESRWNFGTFSHLIDILVAPFHKNFSTLELGLGSWLKMGTIGRRHSNKGGRMKSAF